MARSKKVDEALARKAKAEMRNIIDHVVCFRLQAIVSCVHHPVIVVGSIMGVHRATIWRWITRFQEGGIEALRDRPKGHNPKKFNDEQQRCVIQWLTDSKNACVEHVHWTLAKLRDEVEREWGIQMSTTALWHFLRRGGFRQKVPLPVHAKADPVAQEAFKKNS